MTALQTNISTLSNEARPPTDQASRLREMVQAMSVNQCAAPRPCLGSCRFLSITSGKGGVGKTTLGVNLCIALAQRGVRVTLLDADLGMANADVLCGLNPTRRLELAVAPDATRRTLAELVVEAPGGFRLIPGSVGIARVAAMTAGERVDVLDQLVELERSSDLIVVDTGAGLSPGVLGFAEAGDLCLVVATPEPTSIADAYAMIKCLRTRATDGSTMAIRLIVNQCRSVAEAVGVHARIDAVARKFLGCGVDLAGHVRSDAEVAASVRERKPVVLRSPSSIATADVRSLSECLAGVLSLRLAQRPRATSRLLRFLKRST